MSFGVDAGVVGIYGHPGLGVGAGEAAIRGAGPLNWGTGVVAGFLLVFLAGAGLGFCVEWSVSKESGEVSSYVRLFGYS